MHDDLGVEKAKGLEHFPKFFRPELCWYPTHSAGKRGMDGARESTVNPKMLQTHSWMRPQFACFCGDNRRKMFIISYLDGSSQFHSLERRDLLQWQGAGNPGYAWVTSKGGGGWGVSQAGGTRERFIGERRPSEMVSVFMLHRLIVRRHSVIICKKSEAK